MKVFLVGLPGSGKTTIGRELANRLQLKFTDLDHEIELREGVIVPQIFSSKGEDYFRRLESEILHEWAHSDSTFVMSTGGGTPCFHDGMRVINEHGVSVFLDEKIEVIVSRLRNDTHRPLLQQDDAGNMRTKLETLRRTRLPFYDQAAITVQSPTVEKILGLLQDFDPKR